MADKTLKPDWWRATSRVLIAGLAGAGAGCTSHTFGASTFVAVVCGSVITGIVTALLGWIANPPAPGAAAAQAPSTPPQPNSPTDGAQLAGDYDVILQGTDKPIKILGTLKLKKSSDVVSNPPEPDEDE